jgi:hypothetical protein
MKKSSTPSISAGCEVATLFGRVAGILESARGRVIRAINHETVTTYWLIGREIVQALQGGEARAQYGNALIADLSQRLTERYGAGFSAANLKNFRQFYLTYSDRPAPIGHPSGSQWAAPDGANPISYPAGSETPPSFHHNLSWSHYRALMRVANSAARYSVLSDSRQLFAAKYQFTLPSEEELQREIQRERALIENQRES